MRNASGTARPAASAAPCGLMFAAMDGAISASDRPSACHTFKDRFSPGSAAVFWAGVVAIATSQEHDRFAASVTDVPPLAEEGVTTVNVEHLNEIDLEYAQALRWRRE